MKNEPKVLVGVKVKPSTLRAIKADAEKDDRTVSYIAAQILDKHYKVEKYTSSVDHVEKWGKNVEYSIAVGGPTIFDQFWNAGMRKIGKKKSQALFDKLISKIGNTYATQFTQRLVNDIKSRLEINQLGFSEMHPTTYLNGERWNDEIKGLSNGQTKTKSTFDELTDRSWAEKQ